MPTNLRGISNHSLEFVVYNQANTNNMPTGAVQRSDKDLIFKSYLEKWMLFLKHKFEMLELKSFRAKT